MGLRAVYPPSEALKRTLIEGDCYGKRSNNHRGRD